MQLPIYGSVYSGANYEVLSFDPISPLHERRDGPDGFMRARPAVLSPDRVIEVPDGAELVSHDVPRERWLRWTFEGVERVEGPHDVFAFCCQGVHGCRLVSGPGRLPA